MSKAFFSHPIRTLCCLFAALLMTSTQAQDKPADFATQVPLTISGQGPWYRLELPLAVQLAARQADLSDVRVFDASGQAQAYALTQNDASRRKPQTPVAVKWFALYSTSDAGDKAPGIRVQRSAGGTVIEVQPQDDIEAGDEVLRGWLLDTSAIKSPLEQLILDWSNERQGFQRFSIEASDDLQRWQNWGDGQVARLSFADEMVEQREVALPGRPARYLRLLWRSPHTAPTLTSAQLISANPDNLPLPLVWSQPLAGTTSKPGEYSWQLPNALAVARIKIDLAQPNSLAPVTLSGRSDAKLPWQNMGGGLLYRLTQNGQDVLQNELQLPGLPIQQLKLDVDQRGGGLGTNTPQLSVAVHATQLVFLAKGAGPYSLAVGNASVKAANLPLSTLIPDFSPQTLGSLGSAQLAAIPMITTSSPVEAPGTDWKRIGLWTVLLLGVIFLGWMALSLLRAPPTKS
ncbi:DUF3999 domain-containing protein [Pseudomonas sp. NA-150]|uniref:DUF3999 domain-containing protein n=1 Tax=Pseudomonas sp. NA-150 TaxID=3367525 RepID=UPI0037C78B06